MCEGFEFAADDIGGKAGGQERTVDGGEFFLVNFAPEGAELAFDTLTDYRGFVIGFGGLGEGGTYVTVGNAASAEVACDAEFALFAAFGALARELFGVTRIIKLARFFQTGENDLRKELGIGTAQEFRFHFVYGVSAAHEDAQGVVIEVLLGVEFARPGEHVRRLKQGRNEVKRGKAIDSESAQRKSSEEDGEKSRMGNRDQMS